MASVPFIQMVRLTVSLPARGSFGRASHRSPRAGSKPIHSTMERLGRQTGSWISDECINSIVPSESILVSTVGGRIVDEDLAEMTREQLIEAVKKLRQGIRDHRDSSGHQLCWHHPALWGLLRRRPILFPLFRRRNSWKGVSSIGSLLMSKRLKLRAARSNISGDSSRSVIANTVVQERVIGRRRK